MIWDTLYSGSHRLSHGTAIIWLKVSMYFRFQANLRNLLTSLKGRGVNWAAAGPGSYALEGAFFELSQNTYNPVSESNQYHIIYFPYF